MIPYKHQLEISNKAYNILKNKGLVYLSMEERTGKTLTSLLCAEKTKAKKILIITKKKAINGWIDTLKKIKKTKEYVVINYESTHKLVYTNFNLTILDEAHVNLGSYPKLGKRAKEIQKITYNMPIIYLSATPSAQSHSQLYHQFFMTKYSPFRKYKNFYKWFADYGIKKSIWLNGREMAQYDKTIDVLKDIKDLFISYTRKELGFIQEPKDIIHFIKLDTYTKIIYKELEDHQISYINNIPIVADTSMSLMTKLHQIEGGTIKTEKEDILLINEEKIAYILNSFGDTNDIVIFYHYQAEKEKLEKHFKNIKILQATAFAEGIDLSMYKTLIVYSMDFSTARYTQRRARQANINRKENINVHFLLVKGGISEQVYNTVAINKKNFVNKFYEKGLIE